MSSLRCTTVPATPSPTCAMNRPRWVRCAGGREKSYSAKTPAVSTVAPTTARTCHPEMRIRATTMARTATAGSRASTPPRSSPSTGRPSTATARVPSPHTARLPRRESRPEATAAARTSVAAARRAKATLPIPWNRPAMMGLSAKGALSDSGEPVVASARGRQSSPHRGRRGTPAVAPGPGRAAAASPRASAMPTVSGSCGQVPARHHGSSCIRKPARERQRRSRRGRRPRPAPGASDQRDRTRAGRPRQPPGSTSHGGPHDD